MKNQKTPQPVTTERLKASLRGEIQLPGDKSISHRSFILSALAVGTSKIQGLLEGEDVLATGKAMQAMGAQTVRQADGTWEVTGRGVSGLTSPDEALDFGNSGTGIRLTLGAMTGCPVTAKCVGDESLSRRPMGRVTEPLEQMGAVFEFHGVARGQLPLTLTSPQRALPIDYVLPVASAQVKSCILLAGLGAPGITAVTEKHSTRDHTERMLTIFGAKISSTPEGKGPVKGRRIELSGETELLATTINVPGDPSSAAFPMVAGLLSDGAEILLKNVMVNPYRSGLWDCLKEMGGKIEEVNMRDAAGEKVVDYIVKGSELIGIDVPPEKAPDMIDEFPILAMAAACARGTTHLHGLAELRVKESDRLAAIADGLKLCGVTVTEGEDDLVIEGCDGPVPGLQDNVPITTHLDHRIAMSFLVLGLNSEKPIRIDDSRMIATSFPNFFELMGTLGAKFIS